MNDTTQISSLADITPTYVAILVAVLIWSGIWKAFALYRAGKVRQPVWFVVFLFVNTLGILEILYLFLFSKKANQAINAPVE